MAEFYDGNILQIDQSSPGILWKKHENNFINNDVAYSQVKEVDLTLNTTRYQICCPIEGREPYVVDGVTHYVAPDEFLILNKGQHARAEGRSVSPIKGFCFMLSEETLQEVLSETQNPLDILPDTGHSPIDFVAQRYKLNENKLGHHLISLKEGFIRKKPLEINDWDEFYFSLARLLVETFHKERLQAGQIELKSLSYREEVFKRLSLTRAFILENYQRPLSLDELSQIACFSKYHLLRLYKRVFGKTPYQHVLQLRIEKSQTLLKENLTPRQCAQRLSFSDRRAFSKAFKQHVGMTPSQFQK